MKQHVPSSNGNKSAGALMSLAGIADFKAMNDTLLSVNSHTGISTFYGYYVLIARAEGTFPTPYGLISVRHEKDSDGKVISQVDAPPGVEIVLK